MHMPSCILQAKAVVNPLAPSSLRVFTLCIYVHTRAGIKRTNGAPLVQLALGSRETNQGFTYLRLQYIHMIEPNPKGWSEVVQATGRGVRRGTHMGLEHFEEHMREVCVYVSCMYHMCVQNVCAYVLLCMYVCVYRLICMLQEVFQRHR